MTPIFHVLSRKSTNEPLIDEFLYGEYTSRPYPPTAYSECEDGSTIEYSKNIARVPKIIGCGCLAVPTDLMLDLRDSVKAKWRKIKFAEPFNYDWNSDGFQIIEEYEESRRLELSANGIVDPYEQDNHILTDEGLVYLDMVKRFRIEAFSPKTTYWEMILVNSYRTIEVENPKNVVVVSTTDRTIHRVSGRLDRESLDDNEWPMSIDGLYEHKILSLQCGGAYALTPTAMKKIEPWLQADYYSVRPVFEDELPLAD